MQETRVMRWQRIPALWLTPVPYKRTARAAPISGNAQVQLAVMSWQLAVGSRFNN
jgi:hypothetical protein